MEYSTIANLSAKGIAAREGDCGVQGMSFVTLCRAAGVPARWQSGWQTKPDRWNMHDWSEFYVEPWGWLPADASYGLQEHEDVRVREFFCGNLDPYRLIVNLDYGRELHPPKHSFRSEPMIFNGARSRSTGTTFISTSGSGRSKSRPCRSTAGWPVSKRPWTRLSPSN